MIREVLFIIERPTALLSIDLTRYWVAIAADYITLCPFVRFVAQYEVVSTLLTISIWMSGRGATRKVKPFLCKDKIIISKQAQCPGFSHI